MISLHLGVEPDHHGARQCPRPDAVSALLERLKSPLRKHHIFEPLAYHNAYTIYVIALQTLALAYRGVISPAVTDWDVATDLVTWTDKARSDYHRRVSNLPPVSVRLSKNYSDHRRYMLRHYKEYASVDERGVVFALWHRDRGRFREFHPSDFDAYSGEYRLPLRSLRRFMRTALVTRIIAGEIHGLPVEVVDGWMGHWREGLSPREVLSTFPPGIIRELVEGPVSQILVILGCIAYTSRYIDYGR